MWPPAKRSRRVLRVQWNGAVYQDKCAVLTPRVEPAIDSPPRRFWVSPGKSPLAFGHSRSLIGQRERMPVRTLMQFKGGQL